jgi:hypothetical protein
MKCRYCILLFLACNVLLSCGKSFLTAKPSTDIATLDSLPDYEQLLNNPLMTQTASLPILSADEYYYATYASWEATFTATERNAYIWADSLYNGEDPIEDWDMQFQQIYYANVILAGLPNIPMTSGNLGQFNLVKGWAYFIRGFALYNLVSEFATLYDSSTASRDLGMPIRLTPDASVALPRSSMKQTYAQIFADLVQAGSLLPLNGSPSNPSQPSKMANWALYARIYLSIRNYPLALLYADSCIQNGIALMDFNTLDTTSYTPINGINPETIYYCTVPVQYNATEVGPYAVSIIDTTLYASYDSSDLRKHIYFFMNTGQAFMKTGYTGSQGEPCPFTGIAADEIYLIQAECLARAGNTTAAMQALTTLLDNRYVHGATLPTVSSPLGVLPLVEAERKKELVWRGLRWGDLKRYNKEGQNITLTRLLNGQTITLPPNDLRYVLPIPQYEINLSGIAQNPR